MLLTVVTPTYRRPAEVAGLLANLAEQTLHPDEIILVDCDPSSGTAAAADANEVPFPVRVVVSERGTA